MDNHKANSFPLYDPRSVPSNDAVVRSAVLHKSEFYAKLAFNNFVYVRHSFNSNSSNHLFWLPQNFFV